MTIPLTGIYYLTMRLWIGLWAAFFCLIIVAVDGSAIVRYFTRWAFQPDFQLDLMIKTTVLYQIHRRSLCRTGWHHLHQGVIVKAVQ